MNENANVGRLVAFLPFLLLTGCISTARVQRYTDAHFTPTDTVDVVRTGPLEQSFVEIGEISVDGRKRHPIDSFVNRAKALGADAIVLMGERNRRVISHVIAERIVSRTRWDLWAVAIRYTREFPPLEKRMEHWKRFVKRRVGLELLTLYMPKPVTRSKPEPNLEPKLPFTSVPAPVTKEEVQIPIKKLEVVTPVPEFLPELQVIQPDEAVQEHAVKSVAEVPVVKPALERQVIQPEVGRLDEGVPHPHYAVVKLQKIYTAEGWSALTNFTVVTATPSLKECLTLLENSGEAQVSAECVDQNHQYEKMFKRQPIGDWYVTVDFRNAYPWIALIDFGALNSRSGKPLAWNDDLKLEVSAALAAGAAFDAELDGIEANIHIYSPTGEVALQHAT